jgi:hypothetical protein
MMKINESKLSSQAQELIKLAGAGNSESAPPNVAKIIQDRPELLAGLNEYLAWHADHWVAVSQTTAQTSVPHPLSGISESLGRKK